jgi:hypothetical protein
MVAPWIIDATENSFMGYNVAGVGHGFQPLKSTGTPAAGQSEYTFRATAAGNFGSGRLATDIVDIVTGTQTLNANTTIYALRTAQNIAPTASFNSLTLGSGGLIMTGGTINPVQTAAATVSPVTLQMTLNFGANEALIYNAVATGTINAQITGSAGLTKFGAAQLNLSGSNSGLTGTITLNQGNLVLFNPVSNNGTAIASVTNSQEVVVNGGLAAHPELHRQ